MTVSQLIVKLNGLNPDALVILQKDREGNGYSKLEDIDDNAVYVPDTGWSGDVMLHHLTPELKKDGFTSDDVGDGEICVVLYPVS